jgi:hypothetical protein
VDAREIVDTVEGRSAFSFIPSPLTHRTKQDRKIQAPKNGVAAFFGSWPGDETDEELLAALGELRHCPPAMSKSYVLPLITTDKDFAHLDKRLIQVHWVDPSGSGRVAP